MGRSEVGTHIGQLGNSLLQEFGSECSRDLGHNVASIINICIQGRFKDVKKEAGISPTLKSPSTGKQ